jgi:type II secretory pathway pseudopilin PulG
MVMAVAVLGILAAVLLPKMTAVLQRGGTGQAASVVASDLEQALSLAARQRKPIRVTCDCGAGRYAITDRATGTVLFQRLLAGADGQMALSTLAFSTNPIDIFPNGMTSAALTVTVSSSAVSRQVTMSTGGFVRVVR